jgi:tetratricopeptide (TPR) repeat protein
MLSVDKVEGMLTEYFKKYGNFLFSDNDYDREELSLTNQEIIKICKAYPESHRLYIYQSCVGIFHRLFVEPEGEMMPDDEIEPIEDIFNKMERIFGTYTMDASYFHLNVLLDFLRLEYYNHYRLYRKAEKYFDEVNDTSERLLTSYNAYTYPSRFLLTKLERHNRMGTSDSLYAENEAIFADFEPDPQDVAQYTIYMCYRALSCYHVKRYDQAAKWINQLLDTVSLKKYPYVYLEVKLLLSIQYCLMRESDLLAQLINSIQRQIRQLGKETCIHVVMMVKILKASMQSSRSDKEGKIRALLDKLRKTSYQGFSVTTYVKADDDFVARLSA